jgi:hypothetical protein
VPPPSGISFQIPAQAPPPAPPSPVTPIQPAPASPPPDLFRAGPDTYAPRFNRQVPVPLVPYAIGGYPAFPERVLERTVFIVTPPQAVDSQQPAAQTAPTASSASQRPESAVPPAPGHKRPLYVIPNCYLGDTPPAADRLPKGCLPSQARQIPRR